jgi:cytochrome c
MIRRDVFRMTAAGLALCSAWTLAQAQERGTMDEAKAMAQRALEHVKKVGTEKAFNDFTNDKENWNKKDIYIFANNMTGQQFAHGANAKQVGKNFWEVKDADGKLLFQEFSAAAAKGGGWVEYQWAHPQTKKIEAKASYIVKIPGSDYYLGAGAYK